MYLLVRKLDNGQQLSRHMLSVLEGQVRSQPDPLDGLDLAGRRAVLERDFAKRAPPDLLDVIPLLVDPRAPNVPRGVGDVAGLDGALVVEDVALEHPVADQVWYSPLEVRRARVHSVDMERTGREGSRWTRGSRVEDTNVGS